MTVSAECEGLGNAVGTTIGRVVQEAVSNAVRHAEPKVAASAAATPNATATRSQLPSRMTARACESRGLIAVSERLGALGGQLSFANTSAGGFRLIAVLPYALPASVQPVEP